MSAFSTRPAAVAVLTIVGMAGATATTAQTPPAADLSANLSAAPQRGPDINGIISARSGDRMQVTAEDGSKTVISINDATEIRASNGFLGMGRTRLAATQLLNGVPVTVRTLQSGDSLLAQRIVMKGRDLRTASMIRAGTEQGFAEQTAATAALRGRFADIDQYNVKKTTTVYFDTGKTNLSEQAKAELCATTGEADQMKNALLLIVGYTDSVGSEDYNQTLSERRASRVVNYMQQVCGWKPYRMLTPTGMAEADPAATNDTVDGKAQNRRVAVNVLVSKAVDGLEVAANR